MAEHLNQTCKQCGHVNVPINYMVGVASRGFWFCSKACREEYDSFFDPEKEAEEAEKARLEKEALENAQKSKLSALEAAKLAISLVETMLLEELRPVIDILKNPKEITEVLQNANDELIGRYTEKIEAIYASRGIMPNEPFYDTQLRTDLERCMSLGMNLIEKKLELEGISGNVPSNVSGKKIEKTRKWKEIQRDLK